MSDQRPLSVDPALWRGLTQSRTTRRSILQRAAALAAVGVAASACGVAGSTAGSSSSGRDWSAWWAKQPKTDQLVLSLIHI